MSRKLSLHLERFGPGRDGGIDLADDADKRNIIVQVKHYIKTDVQGLIRSLKKEVSKVEEISPNQYYVCCSKSLTPDNKKYIYKLFSKFMDSTKNIITELELNEFLEASENTDILRKHFKLWLDSTNILLDIFSNDIFVDSEVLLSDVEEEAKYFVRTQAFDEGVSHLEKRNVLLILGNPGVGKTITSKMLVLYYASLGYRVRYTTDGSDLKSLKKSLSQSPEAKEIILLDDCFGQAYFNIKETQESELLALIKYVNISPNKLMIMNSRISIYREARDRTPVLIKSFDQKEYSAYILEIECISTEEKAKIFYNHLYFSDVPEEYFENVKSSRNYSKIVNHNNYNPRIIEYICSPHQFEHVLPNQYSDFALKCLDNPEQVWKNEYERRLAKEDRLFLTTLYSLSDTIVPFNMVKQCFEHRVSQEPDLDSSINRFEQALNRLMDSMVKIVDKQGVKMLCVANPSVNDFLREYLSENIPAKEALIKSCNSVRQLKRLLTPSSYKAYISKLFDDHSISTFVFEDQRQKIGFITAWCVLNKIYDSAYASHINSYIFDIRDVNMYESERVSTSDILQGLLNKDAIVFYGLEKILYDNEKLYEILEKLSLEDMVEMINFIDWIFEGPHRNSYINAIQNIIQESIDSYCYDVPADSYYDDIPYVIKICEDELGYIDTESAITLLEDIVKDAVLDELSTILSTLPNDINPDNKLCLGASVSVSDAENIITSYLRDDYDIYESYDDYLGCEFNSVGVENILDNIFDRKFRQG